MTHLTHIMLRNFDTIRLRIHHQSFRVGCYYLVVDKKSPKTAANSQKSSIQIYSTNDSDSFGKSDVNVKIHRRKEMIKLSTVFGNKRIAVAAVALATTVICSFSFNQAVAAGEAGHVAGAVNTVAATDIVKTTPEAGNFSDNQFSKSDEERIDALRKSIIATADAIYYNANHALLSLKTVKTAEEISESAKTILTEKATETTDKPAKSQSTPVATTAAPAAAAPAAAPAAPASLGDTSGSYDSAMARAVFDLVNQQRAAAGLPALTWNDTLAESASIRATEIVVNWSHTRPDGSEWWTAGAQTEMGENLAYGQTSAEQAMTEWMNSPGHAENVLRSSFTTLGVSCYVCNGTYYWVQHFA